MTWISLTKLLLQFLKTENVQLQRKETKPNHFGWYDLNNKIIVVSRNQFRLSPDRKPLYTLLHEIGHHLDVWEEWQARSKLSLELVANYNAMAILHLANLTHDVSKYRNLYYISLQETHLCRLSETSPAVNLLNLFALNGIR